MRPIVVALLGILLAAAGCVSPAGTVKEPAAPAPSAPDREPGPASLVETAPPPEPTFCDSASGCDFWDDDYHEYVLYDVDTYVVDVLIVPSASVDSAADTATMKAAVLAWGDGIADEGAAWFTQGFVLNVYVVGQDTIPQDALADPEIVVVANEHDPFVLFGIGYQLPSLPCRGAATEQYPTHEHGGMIIYAADCEQGGYSCVALNTNFFFGSQNQLYDLVAHEFGHCLGIGHVGDALDFSAKRVPVHDIMSYQETPDQVHCVSSLNLRVLEALYAPLFGQTVSQPVSADDYYTMPTSQYSQVTCANP